MHKSYPASIFKLWRWEYTYKILGMHTALEEWGRNKPSHTVNGPHEAWNGGFPSFHFWSITVCTGVGQRTVHIYLCREVKSDKLQKGQGWTGIATKAWTCAVTMPCPAASDPLSPCVFFLNRARLWRTG